jgi:hypothetical protein
MEAEMIILFIVSSSKKDELNSNLNSLKSGLLHLTGQKGKAKVKDGIILWNILGTISVYGYTHLELKTQGPGFVLRANVG